MKDLYLSIRATSCFIVFPLSTGQAVISIISAAAVFCLHIIASKCSTINSRRLL
jgi:hypothetical protein